MSKKGYVSAYQGMSARGVFRSKKGKSSGMPAEVTFLGQFKPELAMRI
jgi:hypothetical protein